MSVEMNYSGQLRHRHMGSPLWKQTEGEREREWESVKNASRKGARHAGDGCCWEEAPLLTWATLNHHGKGIHIAGEGKMDGANLRGILIHHVSFRHVINITGPKVFSF